MASYKPRIVDEAIAHRLKNKGAILTGTSPYAYRRDDGVYVVPITALKN